MADHAVARFDVANFRADFAHRRTGFVAEQVRQPFVRSFHAVNLTDLRAANARGMNFHKHLAVAQRRYFHFIEDKWLALFNQYGGGSFHPLNQ